MTTQEFIEELRNVSVRFDWTLEADTGIYAARRKWPRLHLRGVLRGGNDAGSFFEPLGALCYAKTGRIFEPKAWIQAGDLLELIPARAADIHAASEDRTWAGEEGHREPVEYLQVLRDRLIEAVRVEATLPPTHAPTARD